MTRHVVLRHVARALDVPDATFAAPDLTTFARLDELGLEVLGQRVHPGSGRAPIGFMSTRPTYSELAQMVVPLGA